MMKGQYQRMQRMITIVPVADLRREPDHSSERMSQTLFGSQVVVEEKSGRFARVRTDDDYLAWIAQSYLDETPTRDPDRVVTSNLARFRILPEGTALFLPHGARLRSGEGDRMFKGWRAGQTLTLEAGVVIADSDSNKFDPVELAMQFHSCPYLWGGTSPFGFDCSGLVQAVFRRCGILLPRDSKDQAKVGAEVDWEAAKSGDLICFPGHVAIHLGNKKIIHANRLRGMVTVESLDPESSDRRGDLVDQVTTIRRLQMQEKAGYTKGDN
jgi:cell wall-associated NlpC family hydrolase